jgi:hypothetical protein|tara:strand:- start:4628 stop:4867 length:240 start_codon:yes stop_codon:yes gene_type:complete
MADSNFDNSLALWKRTKRDTDVAGKAYPHYNGKLTVDGKQKDVAIWLNTNKTKESQPDMSGKISEPYVKPQENNEVAPF